MSKLRIALVNPVIAPNQSFRYYNTQMMVLKKGLERYCDILIITRRERNIEQPKNISEFKNVVLLDYIKIPGLFEISRSIGIYLVGLERILDAYKPDVVVCTEDFSLSTLRVVKYCKSKHTKSIVWHGPYFYFGLFKGIPHFVYTKTFGRYVYDNADCWILKTKQALKFIRNQGTSVDKLEVIPPCIDMDLFKVKETSVKEIERWFPSECKTILFVGQLSKIKQIDILLRAFQNVRECRKTNLLIISQGGPEFHRIIKLITILGLKGEVTLLRNVPNTIMPYFYSKAYLTVSSTMDVEIFGMNILESLACGTPVVSTPHAGAKEIIKHRENGYICSDFSQPALEEGLRSLLKDDKLYHDLASNARELVIGNFGIEPTSNEWYQVVSALVGKR